MAGPAKRKRRVLIVGGGFAGAFTAKHLHRRSGGEFEIELINSTNYFVFQPLLPEVVSGTISAPDAVTPLRYMLQGVQVRMADVTGVDLAANELHLLQGSRRFPQTVPYDYLVLAMGQQTDLARAPGLDSHGLCVRDLAGAHELRNRIIRCLEHADVTNRPDLKQRLLTFVVAGGGFSGVEIMGEMVEMIYRTLRFYNNIEPEDIRPVLVHSGDRLLPELPERLGRYAEQKLRDRGVDIRLQRRVVGATATMVHLDDQSRIATDTIVATAGSRPRKLATSLGLELTRGRIVVDECLRLPDHDNVWCVGDAALVPLPSAAGEDARYAPPTAQFAVHQAKRAAANIIAAARGRRQRDFDYQPVGSLASIGNYRAVAEIFGMRLSGLFAWLMWRGLYIGMLPGLSTRLRVALNWLFDYFLPRSIVQITNSPGQATAYRRYAAGDVICRPGQLMDGLYSVITGRVEWRLLEEDGADSASRTLGPGAHWGDDALTGDHLARGIYVALEDTQVLVLQRADFLRLSAAFPAIDGYLATSAETGETAGASR